MCETNLYWLSPLQSASKQYWEKSESLMHLRVSLMDGMVWVMGQRELDMVAYFDVVVSSCLKRSMYVCTSQKSSCCCFCCWCSLLSMCLLCIYACFLTCTGTTSVLYFFSAQYINGVQPSSNEQNILEFDFKIPVFFYFVCKQIYGMSISIQ